MTQKPSVRVAAVQLSPDLEAADGTVAKVLAAISDAVREGRKARRFSGDFRALVPVFLLCSSARRHRRGTYPPL